jgi:phosphoribosylanthranilate isomerase
MGAARLVAAPMFCVFDYRAMTVAVQIYGVTTPDDAGLVAGLGADHVGVAVDETGRAPDGVTIEDASRILAAVPAGTTRVALGLSRDPDELERVSTAVAPDILHIGADLDVFAPQAVRELKARFPAMKVMRAIPVDGPGAIDAALAVEVAADYLLLDTRHAGTGKIGATGSVHDWFVSAEIVRGVGVPVVLAGGLSAANVGEAIRVVRPWGVDSYTLTCVDGDLRRKDPERVRCFLDAARKASEPV